MNLLAHLFLTSDSPPAQMVGNFIADRVKGKAYLEHPPEIARGILLHRWIDSYTDDHPLTMKSKEQLHPYHGKWAGVVIDILNDHFLATEWEVHSPHESLETFAERMHSTLWSQRDKMSSKDRWILDRMISDRWLAGYRDLEGIERAFYGLSKRTGEESFRKARETLLELDTPLRRNFSAFFPELLHAFQHAPPHETDET